MNITALAVGCAISAGCDIVAVSSDVELNSPKWLPPWSARPWIRRPAELAQDDTPMIAVVQHALAQIPGPPEQIIVLLQPTQPFRTPQHVRDAIVLLQESQADSVVSVLELPQTHHASVQIFNLAPDSEEESLGSRLADMPAYRQQIKRAYIRDGTVYAFWRRTVEQFGNIYGQDVRPLVVRPEETCELDTESDWADVERRWTERHAR